jgi:hypothetical protein
VSSKRSPVVLVLVVLAVLAVAVVAAHLAGLGPPLYPSDRPADQRVIMELPIPYQQVENCYTRFEVPDSTTRIRLEAACDSERMTFKNYTMTLTDPNGRVVLRETGSFDVTGEVPIMVPGGARWQADTWTPIAPVAGLYRLSIEGYMGSGKNARAVVVGRDQPPSTSTSSAPATSRK